ncbi:S8 family serine peptidase [Natrarchaeobius oligotrophus]|uniref:PKD domain-containing protein n=1 Tax=Natrarchaeobius chitinivorans TaxID=1679083 RepID=A0A3N6M6K4_NATCH|nr:S8 family serine peptidase [Natrarchaeobius chitinivorans]RQG99213.1 PKD domain-containing protein [Natrarchaeobius chitinivorans]
MTENNNHSNPGRRDVLRSLGAIGGVAALSGVTVAEPGREPGPKPDELLVGTAPTVQTVSVQQNVERELPADASVVHRNDVLGYFAVELPDEASAQADSAVAQRIERADGVAFVEENGTYYALEQSIEPAQYVPDDPGFDQQYAPQVVNAPEAWETTLGSSDVTIAIADTGTDYDHPDLQAQFGSNPGTDPAGGTNDPDARGSAHGTHVSGIASATTDNGEGIAGISNSHLYAVRVLGGGGGGSWSDIADGIQWSADNGADIVNLSLGAQQPSGVVQSAIDYAYDNGTLPIAAAGNDGPCSNCVSYPAAFSNCVAVSAIDSSESLANFSSTGPEIDVAAPGVQVLSTMPNGGYDNMSGTSMASPTAAGVAALGLAANPEWGPSELRQALEETAVDIGLPGNQQGSGRVDAANIVGENGDPPNDVSAVADASPSVVDPGETVTFYGGNSSGPIDSYAWELGDGTEESGETVEHAYDDEGQYTATLSVSGDGDTDSDSVTVTVDEDPDPPGDCDDYPTYDNATVYSPGDRVAYDGAIWEAEMEVMTVPPSHDSMWWSHVQDC